MVQESVGSLDGIELGKIFAERYRLERLLGEGDRKKTYLAEDVKFGDRLVALSLVKPNAAHLDPDGTRREANLLSRVTEHNHIVGFHDANVDGPVQYLVFEYLSGGTFAELIERTAAERDAIPAQSIVRFGRQLAGALAHIHAAGVLHRDVAPHNIWLGSLEKAKLGDFDSAILVGEGQETLPITSDGYASPEERHGEVLDERSDLYSLGGVLISLARAALAFDDPERLCQERRDCPPALTELLVSLVAPHPDDRPSSATEVLSRLNEIRPSLDLYSIIASGEGPEVEFKSSMRFPRGEADFPPSMTDDQRAARLASRIDDLEKAVVKTLAAFLNSSHGGTLLIGIEDDGNVVGIEEDFPTLPEKLGHHVDGWQRRLRDIVTSQLDADAWITLQLTLHSISTLTVAQIYCPPRSQPTWCTFDGKQVFYVRNPAASDPLPPPLWSRYIKERWLS